MGQVRRRFKQLLTLEQRLAHEAQRLIEEQKRYRWAARREILSYVARSKPKRQHAWTNGCAHRMLRSETSMLPFL
jgi:hypothetical protein